MIDLETARKSDVAVAYSGSRISLTMGSEHKLTGQVSSHSNSAMVSYRTSSGERVTDWVGFSALTVVNPAAQAINKKIVELESELVNLRSALKIVETLNV